MRRSCRLPSAGSTSEMPPPRGLLSAFALGSPLFANSFPAMAEILYTVRATCPTIQVRGRFLSWLSPNHVAAVMQGGATAVRIVLPDQLPDKLSATVETQYVFPSRKAYDTYIRDHAPAMRADALQHFPPGSGVTWERQVAEIAIEL